MFNEVRMLERKKEAPEEWRQFDLFTEFFPFEEGKKEILFPDGIVLSVDIQKTVYDEDPASTSYCVVSFTLQKEEDSLFLSANINFENKQAVVFTNTRRTTDAHKQRSLPEGIGVQLYTKFLDCLQQIANSQNMTMCHQITSVPAKGMSWHKTFGPVIEKYGYRGPFSSSDEDEVYVKIYRPENKTTSDS